MLSLVGCQTQPEPAPASQRSIASSPAVPRPTIEFAGCRHVEPGRCTMRAGASSPILHVWVDTQPQAPVRVTIDGELVEPERAAVDGGQRLRVTVPEQAQLLRIEAEDPPWAEPFELRFDREQVPAVVMQAHTIAYEGDHAAGLELLQAALPQLEGTDRLAALQTLRKILVLVDPEEARRQTELAAELARALGRERDFAECAAALSVAAMDRGEFATARRWVQELESVADTLPEDRMRARYYGGALASRTGDLDHAIRSLAEARRLAQHVNMPRFLLAVDTQLGVALAELGRGAEALQVANETLDHIDDPQVGCTDRGIALGGVAWTNLLLANNEQPHESPRDLLEQQLELVGEGGECPDPNTAALVNLATAALAEHEPEEALAWIREQEAAGVPEYLQPWVDEVTAQIGAQTGREELLPDIVQRPDPGDGELGLRWMAIVQHARTLDALGLREAAIDSYREAEAMLEQTVHGVGVDVGRERLLASRRASAEGLVELLVQQGDVEEAFCHARIARGRALRTVDHAARLAGLSPEQRARRDALLFDVIAIQDELALERREDWKFSAPEREHRERRRAERAAKAKQMLDEALRLIGADAEPSECEELPVQPPGVVTILQFPRPEGGSWLFVADEQSTRVRAVADPRVSSWSSDLLEPFEEQFSAARLLRILPTGAGWSVPFHALPIGDGVLLDFAPVVYSLDLRARDQRERELGKALVVANPSEDLPEAKAEALAVASRLQTAGWSVDQYSEAQASRARLTAALTDAALLHYAGHGTHGGLDGWGAALLLYDGDRLEVSDVLALPQVPDAVVLSGCDTATVDLDTVAGGMNLSRAFVLAGARWAIAADGEVDDELARALSVALYEDGVPTHGFDGAEALRRAQLRLREQYPERWHAFRVVGP